MDKLAGTVVCKGGVAYPCTFGRRDDSFVPEVRACALAHEASHASDITAANLCTAEPGRREPFAPELPGQQRIKSECKAHLALYKCLVRLPDSLKQDGTGHGTVVGRVTSFLQQNPGRCPAEFPGDNLPIVENVPK
jgi:hypothetical protein